MGSDFREGDKVYLFEGEVLECVFERYADRGQVKICSRETGNSFFASENSIYHDDKREIHNAIRKAIEENSEKPKRMIKKYLNVFIITSCMGKSNNWSISDDEKTAISLSENNIHCQYMLIAYPIEVEE